MRSSSVVAVSRKATHGPDKLNCAVIRLVAGHGVDGDAHFGRTVKHRSRVARDPTQPNLRQVHLIHAELHDELLERGFQLRPGLMGENITTRGVDLPGLCRGAMLRIGPEVIVQITGLRNPCYQLDELQPGLMAACLGRDSEGNPVRKAGVMGVVIKGGQVAAGDAILVELPAGPQEALKPV
jgi:MOSC domain-containing protein YiiM